MTIAEKKDKILFYCSTTLCKKCILNGETWDALYEDGSKKCLAFSIASDNDINKAYELITNEEPIKDTEETVNNSVSDPVNHPAHYTDGKIEVIDFIEDKKLGFHLGNAVKYIARAGKKDPSKEVEDLNKAKWYVERRIKQLEEA